MNNIRLILLFSPKESENAMKKRVYTLYRVSTKGQVEKDDIPMQKEACRNFAESQGWEIVKEFSEKGVSGFKKSAKERDELQKIQQAAMEGKFDILLVFMFDRLGRRDDETPFIVEWFTKQGIEVWSVNEGQQRFDTHVDKLMNYIRYWQASGESCRFLSCISLAVSEMFRAWSEMRSKSEMVWRNLLTSSLWALERERLVIFMR